MQSDSESYLASNAEVPGHQTPEVEHEWCQFIEVPEQ